MREGFRREFSVADYESLYQDKLRSQIKGTTEEYIEKKATDIGGSVSAEVELSGEEYPTPIGVEIRGSLKGEQRVILQEYVTRDLGIPVEAQRWILYE